MSQARRKYRNPLGFIEAGFRACFLNAHELVSASQALLSANLHAPALSLSVLALEELGKLHAIDGLLFARPDDYKSTAFGKSGKSHQTKLEKFSMFPMFVSLLARQDPRHGKEPQFNQALAIALHDLKRAGNEVFDALPSKSLSDLDRMKQKGFYSEVVDGTFKAPRDMVDPALASAVCHLAWRATTTLDFLFKSGNLKRYFGMARSIRSKLSEHEHRQMEEFAERIADQLFANNDEVADKT